MEKMNDFFGYSVVKKLKLISFDDNQKILVEDENKEKNVTIKKYKKKLNSIKNDKVRKSLLELTKLFKKK